MVHIPQPWVIQRWIDTKKESVGELRAGKLNLFSIERPWLNNEPFVSCVPANPNGYPLRERRFNHGHYDAIEIADIPGREFCLFHIANRACEVNGCVGPGMTIGRLDGELAVLSSRVAFNALMHEFKERPPSGLIILPPPGVGVVA